MTTEISGAGADSTICTRAELTLRSPTLWAYDNKRMLLTIGSSWTDRLWGWFGRTCYYTVDGGEKWTRIDGGGSPAEEPEVALPGSLTSDLQGASFMDPKGNVLFFGNLGAAFITMASRRWTASTAGPCSSRETGGRLRPSTLSAASPENFVPVAWYCGGGKVKLMKIPVGE